MEQWQGCLAPVCQMALKRAHDTVVRRGGHVVSPEDLLLALLDVDTSLTPFLTRWGVDLDELVRTIQCEQPLSPLPGAEAGLAEALTDWLASARERYDRPWLSTHHLLSTLACGAERFQDKAYVAVLEQVPAPAWEALSQSPSLPARTAGGGIARKFDLVRPIDSGALSACPLSASAHELATDIVAQLLEPRGGLLWLQTSSSLRVEGLLGQVRRMAQSVAGAGSRRGESVRRRWYQVEWERAGEDDSTLERLFNAMQSCCRERKPSVFLFQECSPTIFTLLVQRTGILKWRHMLAVARPCIVLTSPPLKHATGPEGWLEDSLGLHLRRFDVPLLSVDECVRYLRFCQPAIERKWQVEITDAALQAAACLARTRDAEGVPDGPDTDPESAMDLLREALGTKLTAQANGSATIAGLRASREDLERRRLIAEARSESTDELVGALNEVSLELAAEEVHLNECTAPIASILGRDDVVRHALRRTGVPLAGADERIRQVLRESERVPKTFMEKYERRL